MFHSVIQTLATADTPSGAPTRAPGTPTLAPGTPTRAPGTPSLAPGTPTQAPGTPTLAPGTPTQAPGSPTISPSTILPTISFAPTSQGYCPAYSASNTNNDTENYSICSIAACPGDTIEITTGYPGYDNGNTYLRLMDPSTGEQLAYNYFGNDGYYCSYITYSFTASCRTYELWEGCISSESCGGQVYYRTLTFSPSPKPTHPTHKPSFRPSHKPTRKPTRKPTHKPSFRPSRKPTRKPSFRPSRKPTRKP